MHRPYRPGDLFTVPLPDGSSARGVVVEMAGRCPLLAFLDANGAPVFVARVDDRPLTVLRWRIVGRHPDRIDAPLTSDRIEAPEIVERRLQALSTGDTWQRPRIVVRDLRTPLRKDAFAELPDDAWLQWRDQLGESDRERVTRWLSDHPHVGVRLYGQAVLSDLGIVRSFASLQRAAIQVANDPGGDALAVFESLRHLRSLDLEGVPGDLYSMHRTTIERVRIVARSDQILDAADLVDATKLNSIACSGAKVTNVEAFAAMPNVRALRLTRTASVKDLTWLARSNVTHLTLDGLTHVEDLAPLAEMAHLEHLTIRGMWQFGVDEYGWIDACRNLRGLSIDAGARRKTTEIYRHRAVGAALPFGRLSAGCPGQPLIAPSIHC